jgi:hypothetical protein
VTRYLRDYEFVAVENLMAPDLVNESRSRESNETYHIVLFVKKGPTPGTHARSLLIGQEPANAVVQSIKSILVAPNRHITSSLSSASCYS